MLPLSEWQIDFGGVLIGHKTVVSISDVEGLGAAELRTQDVLNPVDDGAFPGVDLYAPRTVRIEAGIRTAGDPAAALDKLAEIEAVAANPSIRRTAGALAQLRLRWPGRGTKVLFGRIRRAEAVSTSQAIHGWIPLDLEFTALDPRLHDDEVSSVTLPLDISNTTEGFTAPIVAPITTGIATPETRPGWVINDGTTGAWPTIRISGPVTNPRILHVDSGRVLNLDVTLGVGERIDIETRPGTRWVLRNGSGNAASALSGASRLDLFQIPPGRSEIRWTATDYTNTTRLTVSWRSAWTAL
ncbi:phage tail domain-containing protein [Streptomyces sp. MST-110588]|uniref:phage distal tail protein n=1 Tax=Streptomyces sp. MST-110588 TaxID=2833628 RepID=UPI001F5CAC49|nr:phage tail domain-containing protein [Streptomyces sp. MST-110588]UNO42164.1 phage tail family protein [Streptomyces sp. MST-110588]